ncbi:MAG: hypothetical protein IKK49_01300 [Clostridia bacterium]|nr:hypothetical protein [Clostridia bacterium]
MTDKELKKLSRLELLELLLTESRENERLREELERINAENAVEKSAQHLNETAKQLDSALQKVLSMMSDGCITAIEPDTSSEESETIEETEEAEIIEENEAAEEAEVTEEAETTEEAVDVPVQEPVEQNSPEKEKITALTNPVDYNIYKKLIVFLCKTLIRF